MLVSSIGYLNSNKDIKSVPVKSKSNKSSKDNSGFGHVQGLDNISVYHKNSFAAVLDSLKSFFVGQNEKNNDNLSLIA